MPYLFHLLIDLYTAVTATLPLITTARKINFTSFICLKLVIRMASILDDADLPLARFMAVRSVSTIYRPARFQRPTVSNWPLAGFISFVHSLNGLSNKWSHWHWFGLSFSLLLSLLLSFQTFLSVDFGKDWSNLHFTLQIVFSLQSSADSPTYYKLIFNLSPSLSDHHQLP